MPTEIEAIAIRHSRRADIPAIRAMQERSLRVLGGAFYAPGEIAAFLAEIGTMDDAVVSEGHYFLAADAAGAILASGGWSRQAPGYDRAATGVAADPSEMRAATVRSVFVDPAAARRGIATAMMARIEQDAAAHGVGVLRMMATLSGLPFYARIGYRAEGEKTLALPGGLRFRCMTMSKTLAPDALRAAPRPGSAANDANCDRRKSA
ncbi:MAG: GNAT family N-acetyltransferase [Dongiaceae bacterium]